MTFVAWICFLKNDLFFDTHDEDTTKIRPRYDEASTKIRRTWRIYDEYMTNISATGTIWVANVTGGGASQVRQQQHALRTAENEGARTA